MLFKGVACTLLLVSVAAMSGCSGCVNGSVSVALFDASQNPDEADADPNAPDADPNAPDADPKAPDADLTKPDASVKPPADASVKPPADAAPVGPDAAIPTCDNPATGIPALALETVATGFGEPVLALVPPGDTRIFVAELAGRITYIENGKRVTPPFLDIVSKIGTGGERGFLSMAFHPLYTQNKRFFVFYTAGNGDLTVSEFTATTVNDANEGSEKSLLTIAHSGVGHNGGWIGFQPGDPNHYLYISTGDNAEGAATAAEKKSKLGKILRIDVGTPGTAKIPASNPFVGDVDASPEVWAYGLRNPWRCSFDRVDKHLYIADVGDQSFEEVNVQLANSTGGQNYGWPRFEAKHCTNSNLGCATDDLTMPVYEQAHSPDDAIIGGYVYRGCKMPALHGTYFFGDSQRAFIGSFKWDGGAGVTGTKIYSEFGAIQPFGLGEDALGEILICDARSGAIKRIIAKP